MGWVKSHVHHLLYGLLGIVAVFGLLVTWSVWQKQRQQQAERLLYEAVKIFNAERVREESSHSQILTQFQRVAEEYSNTPAATFAHWYIGHLYYNQGDFAAALAAYQEAQRRSSHRLGLFVPALIALDIGYAQEASGLCSIAIDSFEQVLHSAAHWLRGEAFLGMGRCHEKNGATAEAITTYVRALLDNRVDTITRKKIEEQRAQLRATQGS
jgi:tetratricopeptide (TPR) repeat protein